jgi:hypothetical protein
MANLKEAEKIVVDSSGVATKVGGKVNRVVDIKTAGEAREKYKEITDFIPETGIDVNDLRKQAISPNLRQKLEDYQSQLNVYMAALYQMGEAADDMVAELHFVPSEDVTGETAPRVVSFKFDPERLKNDLDSLNKARELVTDYILNDGHISEVMGKYGDEYAAIVEGLKTRKATEGPTIAKSRTIESLQLQKELDKAGINYNDISDNMKEQYLALAYKSWRAIDRKAQAADLASGAAGAGPPAPLTPAFFLGPPPLGP